MVGSDKLTVVDANIPVTGPLTVQFDQTWKLQTGDRSRAYAVVASQVSDYIEANGIERVIIKGSAGSKQAARRAMLEAAELRGVVMCAASETVVVPLSKAVISRTFGKRKVDEYVKDDEYWLSAISGAPLRAGSREAAFLLIAARSQ